MVAPDAAELLAARKLHAAERAMRDAAQAMLAIDLDEATQHAKELLGAAKMARRWELALRRIAAEKLATPHAQDARARRPTRTSRKTENCCSSGQTRELSNTG